MENYHAQLIEFNLWTDTAEHLFRNEWDVTEAGCWDISVSCLDAHDTGTEKSDAAGTTLEPESQWGHYSLYTLYRL